MWSSYLATAGAGVAGRRKSADSCAVTSAGGREDSKIIPGAVLVTGEDLLSHLESQTCLVTCLHSGTCLTSLMVLKHFLGVKELLSVSSHPTVLTLLSVAGEASLHAALGAGQGDTDPLGLGPALTLHLVAADDLMDLLLCLA